MTSTAARRRQPHLLRIIRMRPRLFVSAGVALVAIALLFALCREWAAATKLLIGWDLGLTLYLALTFHTMLRADLAHIRSRAAMQDEGALALLLLPVAAAVASLAAIFAELVASRGSEFRGLHVMLAILTITLSWTFIHAIFALHYAHDHYGSGHRANGLQFPGDDKPDYWDFAYFSFVVGMTFQVSDVAIAAPALRKSALIHGVIAFFYNIGVLALTINVLAGLS